MGGLVSVWCCPSSSIGDEFAPFVLFLGGWMVLGASGLHSNKANHFW